jgi:hypothetical protein
MQQSKSMKRIGIFAARDDTQALNATIHGAVERLHFWAMMRAFNPNALRDRHFFQPGYHEFWMPHEALLRRYGDEAQIYQTTKAL